MVAPAPSIPRDRRPKVDVGSGVVTSETPINPFPLKIIPDDMVR
jgi:hypothetical protein